MKHSSLPRRILLVLAEPLALPALAVGQYLHDYCHTDRGTGPERKPFLLPL